MAYRKQLTRLKAPYLKRILLHRISRFGLEPADFRDKNHFRMMRDFSNDPDGFLSEALYEDKA